MGVCSGLAKIAYWIPTPSYNKTLIISQVDFTIFPEWYWPEWIQCKLNRAGKEHCWKWDLLNYSQFMYKFSWSHLGRWRVGWIHPLYPLRHYKPSRIIAPLVQTLESVSENAVHSRRPCILRTDFSSAPTSNLLIWDLKFQPTFPVQLYVKYLQPITAISVEVLARNSS